MHDFTLADHPIFSVPESVYNDTTDGDPSEQTGFQSLKHHSSTMVMRGSDLILAAGKELRIANVVDAKVAGSSKAAYKVLHTANIDFNIRQLSLSPEGKFLAVAGSSRVVVVILPRSAYSRLMTSKVEVKSMSVGKYFHGVSGAPKIAKIGWHPWGRGGSSLLVLTSDGAFREYDLSSQVDEPLQTLHFLHQKSRRRGIQADVDAEQVVSYCMGKGVADWGPLTVYALARSGDIYAMSPFLPTYADVPQQYLLSLESFVKVKRDHCTSSGESIVPTSESATYDLQFKYVTTLVKQASPVNATSNFQGQLAHIRRPDTGKAAMPPTRQGPFLLQPAPAEFEDIYGGACDVTYLLCGSTEQQGDNIIADGEGESEQLGVMIVTHADGRVDVMLDVDKVEGAWDVSENRQHEGNTSPAFLVYETIDLGLAEQARKSNTESLLVDNTVSVQVDPMDPQMVFLYHSCGVHTLDINGWISTLSSAMSKNKAAERLAGITLADAIRTAPQTEVDWVLDTFSPREKASAPIAAAVVSNNPHLGYVLLALTTAFQLLPVELSTRISPSPNETMAETTPSHQQAQEGDRTTYMSISMRHPYEPPSLAMLGRKATPRDPGNKFMTSDTLRNFGRHAESTHSKALKIRDDVDKAEARTKLQKAELVRQLEMLRTVDSKLAALRERAEGELKERSYRASEARQALSNRIDRMLRTCLDKASLTLSDVETQWFEELQRLAVTVRGDGDGNSLHERAEAVKHRFHILQDESNHSLDAGSPKPTTLGSTQRKAIERRLQTQNTLLQDARRQVEAISGKLE